MELPRITVDKINFPVNTELTSHSNFYATYPTYLQPFAKQWLKKWLSWFDGLVEGVHDNTGSLISTRIGASLCKKIAHMIFGAGLLFSKKGQPGLNDQEDEALKFISGQYNDDIGLDDAILQAFTYAAAGGTSFIVENADAKLNLWLSVYRMDEGYFNIDFKGDVIGAKIINSKYVKAIPGNPNGARHFILVEERYKGTDKRKREYNKKFGDLIKTAKMKPYDTNAYYVEYNIYETTAMVNLQDVPLGRPLGWSEIPEDTRRDIKENYAGIEIGKPIKLPFRGIGIKAFKFTNGVDNLPNLPYGQSALQDIQADLYSYDYTFSAFNTDIYLGRGRVIAPKPIQNPGNKDRGNVQNSGMDSFLFTMYEGKTGDEQKPIPLQFDLRSQEWENLKNNILETMAMKLELSPNSLAGWLNDGSNRTAREISSEESQTALFVDNKRKLFTRPLNALISDILVFNGKIDGVEVKFSKSGETNVSLLLENTTSAYNAGLKSLYASVKAINPDMSEDELQEEIARIKADTKEKQQAMQPLDFFNDNTGDFNGQETNSEGEGTQTELSSDSNRGMPNGFEGSSQEVSAR